MKKFVSLVASFSILFNSLSTPLVAFAQEVTPVPSEEPTIVEESPTPTSEPIVEPTVEPTQVPSEEPTIVEESPTPTSEPIVEPTVEPTQEPEQENQSTTNENAENLAPPTITPSPESTAEPVEVLESTEEGIITTEIVENENPFPVTVYNNEWFRLTTDKIDYAPTETAIITGSDFTPNKTYEITVSSTDDPATSTTDEITTDSEGNFTYYYQLDGIYRPDYSVVVKDAEVVVATTTFTDSPACQNDVEGANDEPGQKDLTRMCADYVNVPTTVTTNWDWDDISWSGNNTGDACNLFDTDTDGKVNYAICVTIGGAPAVIQSTTRYSCNNNNVDKCSGPTLLSVSAGTSCSVATNSLDPFSAGNAYPNDTQGSCNINLTDVGGATAKLIDVCSYPSQQPNSDPSDCIVATNAQTGKLEIIKNLVPSNDTGLFNLSIDGAILTSNIGNNGTTGEQIVLASAGGGTTHTFAESAGTGTSLSNYTTTVVCKDNNGTGSTVATTGTNPWSINVVKDKDVVCTITNTRINNASLTIIKDAQPNDAQDFAFTTAGTGLSDFSLDDDADNTLSNTKVFSNLGAGSYSVSEGAVSGWDQTSAICSDGSLVSAINLSSGENVTCTFVNSRLPKLTVTKVVINDNGGTKVVNDFPLFVNGNGVISGVQNTYSTGSYTVSETSSEGYTAIISGDCNSNGEVSLGYGDVKTCTITNDDQTGHLLVNKITVPNDTETVFEITASGSGVVQGLATRNITTGTQVDYEVDAGMYSVSETAETGWQETGNTCDDIVVANGETEECTITNTKQGKIIVKKETTPDGEQQSFNFLSNYDLDGFSLSDGAQNDSGYLTPGVYSVSENVPSGWTLSSTSCSDGSAINSINLSAGETVTCTFNNTKLGKIIVEKQTLPDGSTEEFDFQTDYGQKFSLSDGEQNTSLFLEPGTGYSVSEDAKLGWDLDSVVCSDGSSASNIDLSAGETITCVFTNSQRGSIAGAKLEDSDGTTATIDDQTNVLGWTIELYKCASDFTGCVLQGTDTTDVNGYSFDNLVSGYYQVKEVLTNGWYNLTSLFTNITLDPGEESENNNFINFEKATIVVHKDVVNPNSGQTQDSTVFKVKLNNSNEQNISEGNDVTYSDLLPGTYTISESFIPSGYELVPFINNSNIVSVKSGETHHVYVVNKQKVAKLTVIKEVINDNGGELESEDFTMNVSGQNPSDLSFPGSEAGTTIDLYAGDYSVDESNVLGYEKTLSEECSGTINWGEEETCTITNDDVSPTITLYKEVNNNYNGPLKPSDFSLTINDQAVVQGQAVSVNANVAHSINEVVENGYEFVEIKGDADCPEVLGGTVTLDEGQDLSCTIVNQDLPAKLIVEKVIVGGNKSYEDFGFQINEGEEVSFEMDGSNELILGAGNYEVSEPSEEGYTTTYENCSITLENDETETCTITNTRDLGEIIVKKVIDEDGNLETTEDQILGVEWEIDVDGVEGDVDDPSYGYTDSNGEYKTGQLKTGIYTASEIQQLGYELVDATCSDGSGVSNIQLGKDETVTCTFYNTPNGSIHGFKWNDFDTNGQYGEEELLGDWTINLYKVVGEGEILIDTMTTYSGEGFDYGWYWFDHLFPGDYKVCEELQDGWLQTYPGGDGCHLISVPQSDEEAVQNAVFAPTHNFGNYQPATIGDFIWEDTNGDTIQDPSEPAIAGVTANLYKDDSDGIFEPGTDDVFIGSDTTGGDGLYLFKELAPGDYWVDVEDSTVPAGYFTTTPDPYLILDLDPAENFMLADFGYIPPQPEISIAKSNNNSEADNGETVGYTLNVTNNGNVTLSNVTVYDALPGGFSYVLGTSKLDGLEVSDPSQAGNTLTWNIGTLSPDQTAVVTYDVVIGNNVADGSYKNLVTCTADVARLQESVECNVVESTVTIGSGLGYGGSLTGQVLGTSIELPATGNPTWILLTALSGLVGGTYMLYVDRKKKYAKN